MPISKIASKLLASLVALFSTTSLFADEVLSDGWQFHLGDIESPSLASDTNSFGGEAVRIPHDWAVAGPFDQEAHGGTGKLPWNGVGWYRRILELPESSAGQRVYLDFDGVMAFPTVYLNGEEVGAWDYGYTPFRIDLTKHFIFGEPNVLAVKVDTQKWSSRWYPGAGIYRKVTLVSENPVHIAQWGIGVTTDGDELLGTPSENATLSIAIENHSGSDVELSLEVSISDPEGSIVASETLSATALDRITTHRELTLPVPDVQLWDVENPVHYAATVKVLDSTGNELDDKTVKFGFRTFAFTADDGFHLNGRRLQLYGVNLHHDLGPLGGAFNRSAAQRQLEIMMDMGVNAIRFSHNPPASEFLELCDELGLVVWDEVFDKWAWTAGRDDFEPPLPGYAFRQIRNTILRDRNHPSIVTWSVGNEVNIGDKGEGVTPSRSAMMVGFAKAIDDTRPISMACHIPSSVNGKNFESLDIIGWNYARRYARFREAYPEVPIIYSESASALSTRGYYNPDFPERPSDYDPDYKINSYDMNAAFWSDIPDVEFKLMEEDRFVAGEFVWTGFDYIGEPTPHDADSRSSYFGIVDLCGFPKDRFYLYRSHWRDDVETVHILPHWNWDGREGENVPVFVYTSGDSAELFLNGRSLGKRHKGDRPSRAPNIVTPEAELSVSSGENAKSAIDADLKSAWTATPDDQHPSFEIDLGTNSSVRTIQLDTNGKEHRFAYQIEASKNGKKWETVAEKSTIDLNPWEGTVRVLHSMDTKARYLKLTFTEISEGANAGIADFRVFAEPTTNDYYDVTYDYRLRWDEIAYQPGDLTAIAYRDGEKIGEAQVETVGSPTAIRLTAEKNSVAANGEELVYVTVEAVDAEGRPHPLADNEITFSVSGTGTLVATGNGDPRNFTSFPSKTRELFYGKAQAIVRPETGKPGYITIQANAEGLEPASIQVKTE